MPFGRFIQLKYLFGCFYPYMYFTTEITAHKNLERERELLRKYLK